jgi:predicted house-cleaning noncanonical NTP pyrophosphatase (MazG superfamily)
MSSEKLVRDKIADFVFKERGEVLTTRIASPDELSNLLRQKIMEKALEVSEAKSREELAEELADLFEVIKTLAEKENVVEEMFSKREAKYLERGGFDKGLVLVG